MDKVANIVKSSKSTMQYIIDHYEKHNTVKTRPQTGRFKIIKEYRVR